MRQIDLAWKSFNLNLDEVEVWMRANAGSSYVGNVAGDVLTLWFTDEPDQATGQHIQDYWDGLTEDSDEATSYVSRQTIIDAILTTRTDAVTKNWDQLSVAQRKLLAGLNPTREELGL